MRSWTIRRRFRNLAAFAAFLLAIVPAPTPAALQTDPAALDRTMKAAFERGARDGWRFADETTYFSTVLDAGRAYEIARHDDPDNALLHGYALDLATRLHYDPLTNRDAAVWYLRAAAGERSGDPAFAARAQALLAKLDAEAADPQQLARDAVADATANLAAYPNDPDALVAVVDAELRAYVLVRDPAYRSQALLGAAQPDFPIARVPEDTAGVLWPLAAAARSGAAGYTETDRAAARAMFSHRVSAPKRPATGGALAHRADSIAAAPADEYFGHSRLSPIGVSNEFLRIKKYLDAGWGDRMTPDLLWAIDALHDWQHQYPRDYELPRLLLTAYDTLGRLDSPAALEARIEVRRELTVEYIASPEARSLLAGS